MFKLDAAGWLQVPKLCKHTGGAAAHLMYTHGCVFPREAEKGVGPGPVSHGPQNWQQLHCVTGLGTEKNTWRILGDWCWCQNKRTFKNATSNLRFWLPKVSSVCILFVLKLPLRHIRHPNRFIYSVRTVSVPLITVFKLRAPDISDAVHIATTNVIKTPILWFCVAIMW